MTINTMTSLPFTTKYLSKMRNSKNLLPIYEIIMGTTYQPATSTRTVRRMLL